jgi:hypothetical protein
VARVLSTWVYRGKQALNGRIWVMLTSRAGSGCHSERVDGLHAMACGLVSTHWGTQPGLAGLGQSRATTWWCGGPAMEVRAYRSSAVLLLTPRRVLAR